MKETAIVRTLGTLLFTLSGLGGLSVFPAPCCGATVYHSNGSAANVQALQNAALDGDTITLPAGTFSWTSRLNITKGITLQGATTIAGPSSNPVVTDATIIEDNTPRRGTGAGIISATVNPSQSFRLTGITFTHGTSTVYGQGGAVRVKSIGKQPNRSVRIDHCHFDHLYWGFTIAISGWIYGVDDHNVFDCNPANLSHAVYHDLWGGHTNGNGSWADFPYYGTEKFWFIEDNTIRGGTGAGQTSGVIDSTVGGRYVARHNYFSNTSPGGHGTEGGMQRGCREREVYDNSFNWTINWSGQIHRSGGAIWHDNIFTGNESNGDIHTHLAIYRENGGVGGVATNRWGVANGNNPWDVNDPHGLYESGTSSATLASGTLQDSSKILAPNQWAGYSVTNTNPMSTAYNRAAFVISNTSNTITYYHEGSPPSVLRKLPFHGRFGLPLIFNSGDSYKIYRVLIALDQNGRGKGDLISAASPPAWPNEALEPCMSWNNVHPSTGHAYGFASGYPTELANRDYYNLGAGFPADSTPAVVSSRYTAALNGVAYTGTFTYPHPLVSGNPTAAQRYTRSQQHFQKKKAKKLKS